MKRDLLIGIFVALLLHGGLALGGRFFNGHPKAVATDDAIPVIELAPMPPPDVEPPDVNDATSEAGGDISDLVPPMQADTPSPVASIFSQQIQPPPPPSLNRPTSVVIPGRPGSSGIGTGNGNGLKNLFDLASLDQPPVARVQPRPIYPYEMSRSGISGEVTVGFIVDAEGNVTDPYVIKSSHREFETEALRVILRWKFKPGRKNGAAVRVRMSLPFVFNLSTN